MKITIFGSGYVGLVAAVGFASAGHDVLCIDKNEDRIDMLLDGKVPFHEPGLEELLAAVGERLIFDIEICQYYRNSDVFFIAVGTPSRDDGTANIDEVLNCVKKIARFATKSKAVIGIKSTIPVGTCEIAQNIANSVRSGLSVASVPEFLKEGTALADFMKPDRIILGVEDNFAEEELRALYEPLQLNSDRILVMNYRSSELSKYAANSMLAVRISFMNELARFCDVSGADIHSVRRALGTDPRIGNQFLYAGPGYGGSCFPKDVDSLIAQGNAIQSPLQLVQAAKNANNLQQEYVAATAASMIVGDNKNVTIWGVAFKPGTDDVRETPARKVIEMLLSMGCNVTIHDPVASKNFKDAFGLNVNISDSMYHSLNNADLLVLMTEWRQYRSPDFAIIHSQMRNCAIFDTRNIWSNNAKIATMAIDYRGIGTHDKNS